MTDEKYFNTQTLEEALGISKKSQAKYRADKKIPYSKIGGFVFYKKSRYL
ncbi:MAG: DNA-binding protein [Sulfurimonas sp.]|nr:DNA-binding protein [Sulfurimonas sp.]